MPVQTDGFDLFSESERSTYPMNIAYKAAQFQGEEIANRFLRRMREAIAAEARQANRIEVLIELVNDVGLDIPLFATSLNDGSAEQAFKSDRDRMKQYSIQGFPSYLIINTEGKEVVNKESIINFISRYDRVAPVELQMVFGLDKNITQKWLDSLTNSGHLSVQNAGNGACYSLSSQSDFCSNDAGISSPDAAILKAKTAISFRSATTALSEAVNSNSEASGIKQLPGILVLGGGITIQASGSMVGAVGVAGAPDGKADEKCALAGVKAIQELLEFAD